MPDVESRDAEVQPRLHALAEIAAGKAGAEPDLVAPATAGLDYELGRQEPLPARQRLDHLRYVNDIFNTSLVGLSLDRKSHRNALVSAVKFFSSIFNAATQSCSINRYRPCFTADRIRPPGGSRPTRVGAIASTLPGAFSGFGPDEIPSG